MATDMQYAYKDTHSITLRSLVYFETLQYYRNCGSNVFSCLLDESKAFDRVHCGKLFNVLLSKKLSIVLFVCYLIVMFVKNHVPRGVLIIPIILQCPMEPTRGVLSAILFTLYLDKLLIRLQNSNIGCSINGRIIILEPYHTLMI